ncbi:MAG: DNA starvation/stationary phase protection protein Dps, partial [Planctomycetaceae bacterium]|nr:DNA starvation/stationary phase protection protein Dps [Planctomycetaceae bacterium]
MFPTKNDLAETTRAQVNEILNARLLDVLHLGIHAKDAHWNVKGPQFLQLHELFDNIAGQTQADSDEIAERIAALGGRINASANLIATGSKLAAYPEVVSGL